MPRRTIEPEPELEPDPKVVQIMAAAPVVGGDNTVAHGTGRTTVQAWAVLDDGTVTALVREGDALVVAAASEPVAEETPEGPVETLSGPEAEAPPVEAPAEPEPAEEA